MELLREIFKDSAAGQLSFGYRTAVVSLFASIVLTLFGMLTVLLIHGYQMPIRFGY